MRGAREERTRRREFLRHCAQFTRARSRLICILCTFTHSLTLLTCELLLYLRRRRRRDVISRKKVVIRKSLRACELTNFAAVCEFKVWPSFLAISHHHHHHHQLLPALNCRVTQSQSQFPPASSPLNLRVRAISIISSSLNTNKQKTISSNSDILIFCARNTIITQVTFARWPA